MVSGCKQIYDALVGTIRESVDSLRRDGTDGAIYAILKQKPYNFTTNTIIKGVFKYPGFLFEYTII